MINFFEIMNIQDVDMSEYDEADRSYNEKLVGMYRYMVHVKPYIYDVMTKMDNKEQIANILSIYANLCMTFGEFKAMTVCHMPNLAFKRKFFNDTTGRFNALLNRYKALIGNDDLVLTEAEKKITLGG